MAKRFIGNVKGVGVSDFSWEYYLSSSSAVLDGGSWSATPPTLGNNKYLWMRSKVTLTDGSIQYTVPVCEGVWEEIYGIYAIGDKVDGALSDVTDLKSRMTAEENKVQPLNKGGTGAITAVTARAAILENKALSIAEGGTGKTTATEALKALGGAGIKKVWENASIGSAFGAQTLKISATADYILVLTHRGVVTMVPKGAGKIIYYGNEAYPVQRGFTYTEGSLAITIGEVLNSGWKTNNDVLKPWKVFELKGVI